MRKFLIIDIYNMFFRVMHIINKNDSDELQNGMLLHTMFYMIKKSCDKFNPTHLVVCSDGHKSWRKNYYNAYKMNRIEKLQERNPIDALREERLKDIFVNDFIPFLKEKTNVSFLECDFAEADDLVARFISKHPNDMNIILSTDNDYIQLLSDNVIIYNSMEERIITNKCIFTADDKKIPLKFTLKDGKISVSKIDYMVKKGEPLVPMDDWVEYALFLKCIRGDKSDNIFSAYPGVREKTKKKTIGIRDAFDDRKNNGYNWVSFMNSTWKNPLGEEKIVKECYENNKKIIDLSEIPEDLIKQFDESIDKSLKKEYVSSVGFNLLKYLKKHNLERLLESAQNFSGYFSKSYPKE